MAKVFELQYLFIFGLVTKCSALHPAIKLEFNLADLATLVHVFLDAKHHSHTSYVETGGESIQSLTSRLDIMPNILP